MHSIVVTEIQASILRHRLLDHLNGRADIIAPETVAPELARMLPRFLIAGLDDGRGPGSGGLPAPTGARYSKLCFSPLLESITLDRADAKPHKLPLTPYDFVTYVASITGLGADQAADLVRIYRFEPAELFDHCRTMIDECPAAWRLLLSNEFRLACRMWPVLNESPAKSLFRFPLVDGFRILAECERGSLIMRHLASARAILNRPDFLDALASPLPLHERFSQDQLIEVCRWVEYMMFSSAGLTEMLFGRTAEDVSALPSGYPLWAIARGKMIGGAAAFLDHPEVRKALIAIVEKPPLRPAKQTDEMDADQKASVERRTDMLRNAEIVRWNGLTNEALPLVVLDGIRASYPTRFVGHYRGAVTDNSRPVLARLAAAMREHADPAMQAKVAGASVNGVEGSERKTKYGLKMARLHLPAKGVMGSAARFDPAGWEAPLRDAPLWRMLLDPRGSVALNYLSHPARQQLRKIIVIMRRAYGPFLTSLKWSDEVERVICDMACAISPITADMHIAFALHALGNNAEMQRLLKFEMRRPGYGHGKLPKETI